MRLYAEDKERGQAAWFGDSEGCYENAGLLLDIEARVVYGMYFTEHCFE